MAKQTVVIMDFGGQYKQLIARRVREAGVYCEVHGYKLPLEELKQINPIGIIFTGGPNSVYDEEAPLPQPELFELGIPVLGICYGIQAMAVSLGGVVSPSPVKEYGHTKFQPCGNSPLWKGISGEISVWMSHTDAVTQLPQGFETIGVTDGCVNAAIQDKSRKLYAVQFHPEVNHTQQGEEILHNFLFEVCGAKGDWTMGSYARESIASIREKVGEGRALLALSGGVDSSVCAALMSQAIGDKLTCIFVDTGLMRKDEGDEVEDAFRDSEVHLVRVNAADRFLGKLKGVTDPEQKRKIIGEEFIRVFEAEAKKVGVVDYLVQGTIYPDVIESGEGDAAVIKSHHNVGGLPDYVDFKEIIEPLRLLFKDEVRQLGRELGLPAALVERQPFPGPGLAVRVIGEVTENKLKILREADAIFREEVQAADIPGDAQQYFAVLTDMRSVGVMGDSRTYDYTLALRAVNTSDFMTADWARIPYDILEKVSVRIINEVGSINRIVYDITSKPPATIEWE